MKPVQVAFLYATVKDREYCTGLRRFIAPLERSGLLEVTEFDIHVEELSRQEASRFDLFFCLMSPAFLYFFFDSRDASQDLTFLFRDKQVVPVLIRPSLWENSEFGKLKPLPAKGIVSSMRSEDEGFLLIAKGIQELAEEIQYKKLAQEREVDDFQIIQLLLKESSFYDIVERTSLVFDLRYQNFLKNDYHWNYFIKRFGYDTSRYTKQELEEMVRKNEGIYIREVSIERDKSEILTLIKELYEEFSKTEYECCLVIYDRQSAFYNDYQDYKNSFSKFYGKFMLIQQESQKYRFSGKLMIAYNVFSKLEICELI